jgi:hypothetical protein
MVNLLFLILQLFISKGVSLIERQVGNSFHYTLVLLKEKP